MRLQRKDVASKYYGKHAEIDTENKESVINYLDELLNYLSPANGFEYESNPDFIFCGRKKFIYDEIIEIMGGTKTVDNPVYFILGSLEELICDNNDVHISDSDALGMSWDELRDANDKYISTGVICLEEIQYIRRIMLLIKDYLEGKKNDENYIEISNNKVSAELPNLTDNNYMDTFNQENANFVSILNNKGMFHLSITSGAVVPMNHPKYYEGRKHIVLDKDLENNYVSRQEVEIGKDKFSINESVISEVIEYIKTNFNKLLEVATNQSMEMYDGVSHSINIKLGSIYLTLSELNTKTEEDKQFLNEFENKIIELLTYSR